MTMKRAPISSWVQHIIGSQYGVCFNPFANYSRTIAMPERARRSYTLAASLAASGVDTRQLMGELHG